MATPEEMPDNIREHYDVGVSLDWMPEMAKNDPLGLINLVITNGSYTSRTIALRYLVEAHQELADLIEDSPADTP
jgi:hypothetical protein